MHISIVDNSDRQNYNAWLSPWRYKHHVYIYIYTNKSIYIIYIYIICTKHEVITCQDYMGLP